MTRWLCILSLLMAGCATAPRPARFAPLTVAPKEIQPPPFKEPAVPRVVIPPPPPRLKLVWDWAPDLTWNVWVSDDLSRFTLYQTVVTNECPIPSDNPHLFFTVDAVNTNGLSSYPWLLQ